MRIGLALPHYSDHCDRAELLGCGSRIEEYGFDSVWVRDHLAFEAKRFDPPGNRFVDPFVTLSAVAARTERLALGFAVLIPNRHPVTTVQLLSSLDWISAGRVELGIGIGAFGKQFEAVGMDARARVDHCEDTLALIRTGRASDGGSFEGRSVRITDLHVEPAVRPDLTIWYGSLAPRALDRALRYCDGVLAARCTFDAYEKALADAAPSAAGDPAQLRRATEPLLVIAEDDPRARALFAERYPFGPDDSRDPADLAGAVVVGGPDECVEQLTRFRDAGYDNVILDPRLCMDGFTALVDLLGREVLPHLAAG